MTTHADVLADRRWSTSTRSLLTKAVAEVADPQIRHRGTFGGALAHADPAGDLGAPALALGRRVRDRRHAAATRTVAADDFFVDLFETAIGEGEILTEIRIPKHTGWGAHYEKFVRVAHQWSIVGGRRDGQGRGRHDRRGADRADQHGLDPAAGARRSSRPWSGSRPPTRPSARRPPSAADGTNPPSRPQRRRRLPQAPRHGADPARGPRRGRSADRRMELTHSFTVPGAGRRRLGHLHGPRVASAACFPGATVTEVDGDDFNGTVQGQARPDRAASTPAPGTFVERTTRPTGPSSRPRARTSAATARPAPRSPSHLDRRRRRSHPASTCITDLAITGKPAQFGRGVMQDVSRQAAPGSSSPASRSS